MAAIEPQRATVPKPDDRWTPRPYDRDELLRACIHGGMAGVVTHPLDNVLWKIGLLCDADPNAQFGLSSVASMTPQEVLELVGKASGVMLEEAARIGPVRVDPAPVLEACEAVGDRLAEACRRGERVLLATGHPIGLIMLYAEVGRLLEQRGVELLRPLEGESWEGGHRRGPHEVRFVHGVAVLVVRGSAVHTHSPEPMQRMLQRAHPDLVFADHGFAGAAIEAGIETVSIADVNDPALIVAKALGRTQTVVVMDDNVQPDAYWPCFQAIAARLP
jgi:hypothetical protein